jgi:hypothetical protein
MKAKRKPTSKPHKDKGHEDESHILGACRLLSDSAERAGLIDLAEVLGHIADGNYVNPATGGLDLNAISRWVDNIRTACDDIGNELDSI